MKTSPDEALAALEGASWRAAIAGGRYRKSDIRRCRVFCIQATGREDKDGIGDMEKNSNTYRRPKMLREKK